MNHKLLINIDTFFKPFYVIFNRLKWSGGALNDNNHYMVLKLFGLGSITRIVYVMNTVGITKKEVTFITLDKNRELMDLLQLNAKYIQTRHPLAFLGSVLSTTYQLWIQKQTAILDMERNSNLAGLFRLVIGMGKHCASFYFKDENKRTHGQLFVTLKNKPATHAIAELFNRTYVEPTKRGFLPKVSNKIVVNINSGNYISERKFNPSKYAALLKTLHKENHDWHFYLTGSGTEYEYVKSFKERLLHLGLVSTQVHNIAGRYNLSEFAAFLKEAKLLITNDSGPLHLAYLFGVKTVGIWGPTSSQLVGYKDSDLMLNCNPQIECAPCFVHPKSQIAKVCKGDVTCFKEQNADEMASEIIRFMKLEKGKELIA